MSKMHEEDKKQYLLSVHMINLVSLWGFGSKIVVEFQLASRSEFPNNDIIVFLIGH